MIELGELPRSHSPDIEAQPKNNGSTAPINNDLGFSPDASPYKDHIMLRFWEGTPKKTAPMLMVRISPVAPTTPDEVVWQPILEESHTRVRS